MNCHLKNKKDLFKNKHILSDSVSKETDNTNAMKNEVTLTGIAIGYDNNLIYECSNQATMKAFRFYLDSTELKLVDKVNLWYESDNRIYFLKVEPEKFQAHNDEWVVSSDEMERFNFKHSDGRNLLDEIEEQFRIHALSAHSRLTT